MARRKAYITMNMRLLILGIVLLISHCVFAQYNKNNKTPKVDPQYMLDQNGHRVKPAEFKNGFKGWAKYHSKKLRYPKDAREKGIQGKVLVQFTVDSNGRIQPGSIKVVESLCETCDLEAIRLIKESPTWTPARDVDEGKNIESHNIYPIIFRL